MAALLSLQQHKPQNESYRKESKICERTWLRLGKGVKKEEVKDSEYIPTGMKLGDNPVWLSALQQSEGVVVVAL